MFVYNPKRHEPQPQASENHHDHDSRFRQVEQRVGSLENDVQDFAQLVFSARHADQRQQFHKAVAKTQQQRHWTPGPSLIQQVPSDVKTTPSRGQTTNSDLDKHKEQQSGERSAQASFCTKQLTENRRYLLVMAMPVLCFVTLWSFLGGEAASGHLRQGVDWFKRVVC